MLDRMDENAVKRCTDQMVPLTSAHVRSRPQRGSELAWSLSANIPRKELDEPYDTRLFCHPDVFLYKGVVICIAQDSGVE